jgi:hypothetical protein
LLGLQHCHDGALVAGLGAKSLQNEHLMNKRRSESFNRSTVYLGHPFATLPLTNMFSINQHTTTLSKALLTASLLGGAALSTLGAGSALAVDRFDCRFGGSQSLQHPLCSSIDWVTGWTLEDKKLTNLDLSSTAPASGDFSFIYDDFGTPGLSLHDMWQALITFDPDLPDPLTGSYSYDLDITPAGIAAGWRFESVKLEDVQAGSTKVTKTIVGGGNPVLISTDGGDMGPVLLSGTSIKVTDSWEITPGMGVIDSINNTYTQDVPAPLPILGAGAAFGSIRKLRKFSSRLKTFSMR